MVNGKRIARAQGESQGAQGIEEEGLVSSRREPTFSETPPEVNILARRVIGAAVEVHRHLGPGYAESVDENALVIELGLRDLSYQRQAGFNITYKGQEVGEGRADLLVERRLIVELKAVDRLTDVHFAKAVSYLKAMGLPLALLINFNVPVLMRGVRRVVLNRANLPEEQEQA